MTHIKKWLESNKIYFEILSSVLFGGAAILIAYASYTTSTAQLKTSELAAEPLFYLETLFIKDPETNFYNEQEMRVHNAGSPVFNIEINVKTFICIKTYGSNSGTIFVPVVGYYGAQFDHHNPTGHLSTFKGYKNNYYAAQLDFSSLNNEVQKKYGYFEPSILAVASISYEDRLGRKGTAYFLNRDKATKAEVAHLLSLDKTIFPIELSTVTVDTLMAKIKEIEGGPTRGST